MASPRRPTQERRPPLTEHRQFLFASAARATGRVASGGGECSGGVGPPRPARRPQGCESGEWVTQHEHTPPPDDGTRPPRALTLGEWTGLGRAAGIDAGRLHAIEDAVELVAAIFVRGPDGIERVELGEIAEAAVGGLGHGPLPGPVAPESLSGLDPEALRRLVVEVAGALAGRHGGEEEARGEADRARGRRDEVREVAEGLEVEIPLALGEERGERCPLRHVRLAHRLDAGERFRSADTHGSSRRVARGKHARLLEELAGRGDPIGERGRPVHRGQKALGFRRRQAAATGAHVWRAVFKIHLAAGESVEAAEEAHALLAADHVDLGGRGGAGADEEDGGRGPGSDRRHGAEARERRSSASCSIKASAETGLATTRSTNWLPSWAATLSPQPVRRKTAVSGESDFTRSATSQPFIRGMPRSVMTTSC